MNTERPGVYVTPETHKKIKILAAQRGISIRALIEELIQQELDEGTEKNGVDSDKWGSSKADPPRKKKP